MVDHRAASRFLRTLVPAAGRAACSIACLAACLAAGGCSVGTLNGFISNDTPDDEPVASTKVRGGPAPSVNMAGRWVLATPGGDTCGMTFAAPPGANNGPIAPEGGCPGKFFTSRQWAFERNAIVIRNHTGETLAQFAIADAGRLDGQSTAGDPVSLTR